MSASMLAAVWRLRDVTDVEALCRGVIAEVTGREERRFALEPADYDEALAFLLGEVVVLEGRYDSGRAGIVFRPWLYQRLRWALIDFWRSFYGRHGQHRVFDGRCGDQHRRDGVRAAGAADDDVVGAARPGRLDAAAGGDPADRSDADRWLDADGDRGEAGPVGGLGVGQGARVARRDDRAGAGLARAGGGGSGPAGSVAFRDCSGCGWRSYPQPPNGVSRWHMPDRCVGCGAPLLELVASSSSGGGLEERRESAA